MLCLTTWVGATMSDHPEAGSALFVSAIQISIAVGAVVGGIAVDYLGIPWNMTFGFLLAAAGYLSVILQPRGRSEGV
jgi:predicted MFS family arabinose efflux permease